jgi:hypothetical protein
MAVKRASAELSPPKGRTLSRYQQLGPMPDDPLKINEWTHRALGIAMQQVVADPQMDERERTKTMCELAARMKDLTPMSRLSLAEDAVMGRTAGSAAGGPKMEPVAEKKVEEPKHVAEEVTDVDPGRSGPPAIRGRPRRRSVR